MQRRPQGRGFARTTRVWLRRHPPGSVSRPWIDYGRVYCALVQHSLTAEREAPPKLPEHSWFYRYRFDLAWGAVVSGMVLAAFILPHLHLHGLTPVATPSAGQYKELAQTAPILGSWRPHGNWATPCAVIIAVTIVRWGPSLAKRAPWYRMVVGAWLASLAWTMSLALIDGWGPGFADRLGHPDGYLSTVPRVTNIPGFLRTFAAHIPVARPGSWDIDVSGHPPGALLSFVFLHRIGLGAPVWASTFCVLIGTSSAAAVLITVRALSGETMARRVAPFVTLAPLAIWIAVSADAYYAGMAAWGLTLLALAATGSTRYSTPLSVAAGVVLGFCVYLDYGLILMAIPSMAVMMIARNFRPLFGAAVGALLVAAIFTLAGFSWLEGVSLLRHSYWRGIAKRRPPAYWSWGDLAALTCAIGLAAGTALRRAFNLDALRRRKGLPILLVSFVAVVVLADLTQLSKAETERIWLPFAVWLVTAPALLPRGSHRFSLGVQAVGAVLINSLIFTSW